MSPLRAIRERTGAKPAAAAAAAGVARPTLYTWESGSKRPSQAALSALLDFYQATQEERDAVAHFIALGEAPNVAMRGEVEEVS